MIRRLSVVLVVCIAAGCASLPVKEHRPAVTEPVGVEVPRMVSVPSVGKKASAAKGPALVFGKTDFRGLLKTPYVRLRITAQDNPAKEYFFIVGERANQSVVPWKKGQRIRPGYFYFHLPPGAYRISQIAIPVGSTLAEEDIALDFELRPGVISYVGTLEMNGTRERVKFGGVPIMKPGFEYELAVRDEFDEAAQVLKARFADVQSAFKKELFRKM